MSRIDIHSHYLPDFYKEALLENGHERPDGIPGIPPWSEASALESMDQLGVQKSYLSISSPGIHFGDAAAACALARAVNEEGARLKREHPTRFGYFASLPLPEIDDAIAELVYAFEELDADGVVFSSNFHGMYLGDGRLDPIYAELDRRAAVLFVHPTSPPDGCGEKLRYPRPMLEFLFDSTRAITDMVLSGVLDRFPNIKVIVSHSGAALPVVASRIDVIGAKMVGAQDPMRRALKHLHFDVAGMPLPDALPALLNVADAGNIHYGSDVPFTPLTEVAAVADRLDASEFLSDGLLEKIMLTNSEALFGK